MLFLAPKNGGLFILKNNILNIRIVKLFEHLLLTKHRRLKIMVCTLDKVLEELDKKILKTQNSIKELESELTDCMKEAKECRKVIQEIKEMKKNETKKR